MHCRDVPWRVSTYFCPIQSFNYSLNQSLIYLCPRFVASCDSATGIKRESGAKPELSRSCKSRRRAVQTLTATVRKDGKANRQR